MIHGLHMVILLWTYDVIIAMFLWADVVSMAMLMWAHVVSFSSSSELLGIF